MALFKDPEIQSEFDRNGAFKIQALEESQILQLKNLYKKVIPQNKTGIYSNIQDQSYEMNQFISSEIRKIFDAFIEKYIDDCRVGGATFLVKHPIEDSHSFPHQDYTLVDEKKFTSFNIWCPLVDVDERNGCLQVVLGSHKLFNSIRSINIPSLALPFTEKLSGFLTPFPVKAGTAVVYAHNVFHGSKTNLSKSDRVAAVVGLVPNASERVHLFREGEKVRIVKANEDFFFKEIPEIISGKSFREIPALGFQEFDAKCTISEDHFFDVLSNNYVTNNQKLEN